MNHSLLFASAVLVAFAGCRTSEPKKTTEEQLFEARQEYRQTIDHLYRAYGGTNVPGTPAPDPGTAPTQRDESVVGHVVAEADRSYFERQCLAVGRGGRPFNVSPKMQRFLDGEENARGCRRAAELQTEIARLEERVAKP